MKGYRGDGLAARDDFLDGENGISTCLEGFRPNTLKGFAGYAGRVCVTPNFICAFGFISTSRAIAPARRRGRCFLLPEQIALLLVEGVCISPIGTCTSVRKASKNWLNFDRLLSIIPSVVLGLRAFSGCGQQILKTWGKVADKGLSAVFTNQ